MRSAKRLAALVTEAELRSREVRLVAEVFQFGDVEPRDWIDASFGYCDSHLDQSRMAVIPPAAGGRRPGGTFVFVRQCRFVGDTD